MLKKVGMKMGMEWNPEKSKELLLNAESLIEEHNLDAAKKKLFEIFSHEPGHIDALNDLSIISILENNFDYANKLLEIILKLDPDNEVAKGNFLCLKELIANATDEETPDVSNERKEVTKNPQDGFLCLIPFTTMEFLAGGSVSACCPAFTDVKLGNIKENEIMEMWNSPDIQYVREKMYKFEWEETCRKTCPYISSYVHDDIYIHFRDLDRISTLTPELIDEIKNKKTYLSTAPTVYNFSNSNVCNLHCKMCSKDTIPEDSLVISKAKEYVFNNINTARMLVLSGNGDPFARKDTRELLTNSQYTNSNLQIFLLTNALLLPKYWDKVKHNNFQGIDISMDAASKEVYEKIRIGGKWEEIMEALDFLKNHRDEFKNVTINMTVMRSNYKEIPKFIELAASYGFRPSFRSIRGMYDDENIFEMNDLTALNELHSIIKKEYQEKRVTNTNWQDLVKYAD